MVVGGGRRPEAGNRCSWNPERTSPPPKACREYPSMIDRIVVENFKSLRRIELVLGRMNLFVGANGSGKSNSLDVLRVLQGIGNGLPISELLDGKPRSATSAVWDGIRGGSRRACFAAAGDDRDDEIRIEVHGRFAGGPLQRLLRSAKRRADGEPALGWEFLIAFSPTAGCVTRERFKIAKVIYDTDGVDGFRGRTRGSRCGARLRRRKDGP